MDVPPSRYRVVERDRRLIVVDTLTGDAVTGADPARQARIDALSTRIASPPAQRGEPARPSLAHEPARQSAPMLGGGKMITTDSWYDNKGPREVYLPESKQTALGVAAVATLFAGFTLLITFGLPALIIAGVLFLNVRKGIRAGITGWLDGLEQA